MATSFIVATSGPAVKCCSTSLNHRQENRKTSLERSASGWWDQRYRTTLFIDGGNWLGKPVSPPGLVYNSLYGRSSNQEMLNGPPELKLAPGDRVFLRPTQSEAVLLQFGDLLIFDPEAGMIVDRWAPFRI